MKILFSAVLGKVEKWTRLRLKGGQVFWGLELQLKSGQVWIEGQGERVNHFLLRPATDLQGPVGEIGD